MSKMCRPMWPFLLIYGSHDIRHTSFPQVDGGQRDPREMGRHIFNACNVCADFLLRASATTLSFP